MSDSEILYFSLQLFPSGHRLALHQATGILIHLYCNQDPCIQGCVQLTQTELTVLLPLLRRYPHHCPYAHLLASYSGGRVSEARIEQVNRWLNEADAEGRETHLRSIRNVLSRVRLKLLALDLDICSVLEEGYLLCSPPGHVLAMHRLQSARETSGWSQQEIAERIGTTALNVSRWERGITRPGPYFRAKLCQLFGKSSEELDLGPALAPSEPAAPPPALDGHTQEQV